MASTTANDIRARLQAIDETLEGGIDSFTLDGQISGSVNFDQLRIERKRLRSQLAAMESGSKRSIFKRVQL